GSGYNLVEPLAVSIDEVIEFQVLDRAATETIIAERLEALKARLESAQHATIHFDAGLVTFFADRLAAEHKSLAQLEKLWQESIILPFTQLPIAKRTSTNRAPVIVSVEGQAVKVSFQENGGLPAEQQ